jgi:hypothetical protein
VVVVLYLSTIRDLMADEVMATADRLTRATIPAGSASAPVDVLLAAGEPATLTWYVQRDPALGPFCIYVVAGDGTPLYGVSMEDTELGINGAFPVPTE